MYGTVNLPSTSWALVMALLNHAIREMSLVEPLARPVLADLCAQLKVEGVEP